MVVNPCAKPLEGFSTLSEGTHLYKPENISESAASPEYAPGLIIICSWMFAAHKHIAKYIRSYQALFPNAWVLLLQNNISNMTWVPDRMQIPQLKPAVEVINDFISTHESGSKQPKILLQSFSNGGTHRAVQLAQAYRESFGPGSTAQLPISAFIIDSAPGQPSFGLTIDAVVQGMPKGFLIRAIGTPIAYGVIGLCGAFHYTGLAELAVAKTWRTLNDPNGPFLKPTVPRTYLYSHKDAMVPWADTIEHARLAKAALDEQDSETTGLITCVEFLKAPHVNLVSEDADRYWKAIQNTLRRIPS